MWADWSANEIKFRLKTELDKLKNSALTEEIDASKFSSALVYSALAWTAATVCGCKFLNAANANRETDLSYSRAYHLSVISVRVK